MADAIAFGAARGGERLIYLQPVGTLGVDVDRCIAQRGELRAYEVRRPGEHLYDLGARARAKLDELEEPDKVLVLQRPASLADMLRDFPSINGRKAP